MAVTYILTSKGQCYRVARQTIDLVGRVPMREWVLVPVDPEFGMPTSTMGVLIGAPSSTTTRAEVEQLLLSGGDYGIKKVIQI